MFKNFIFILSLLTMFMFTGCNWDTTSTTTSSSGSGTKGPFVLGSTVKAYKLEDNGSRSTTISELTTATSDNLGTFSFNAIPWSGATELEITGNYFNENTGSTTQNGTLSAIINITAGNSVSANINVLTNLAAKRTKALMLAGSSLADAKTASRASVLELFGMTLATGVDLDDLDLTQGSGTNSAANADLLRISAAIAATPSVLADLERAIEDGNVSNDSNGSLAFATLAQAVNDVNLTTVSNNLETQLGVSDAPDANDTTATASFASNANAPVIATIGAKNYTVSTTATTVNLSASDADGNTVTFSTAVSSDTSKVTVSLSGSTLSIVPIAVGTSTITVTATDGSLIDTETFVVTVTAVTNTAPVLASIANASKTYGDASFDVTLSATDADSDSITYSATSSATSVATVSVNGTTLTILPINTGTSTITVTANDGTVGVDKNMTVTVAQRAVTITAENKTKEYGDANPTLTYTVSPALVSGDSLSGTLERASGEDAGTYAIALGSLANSNYDITFNTNPVVLTITKAVLTATVNPSSKIQGTENPAFSATFTGFKNSETASVLSNLVFSTSANAASAVGTYGVTLTGFTATNYSLGTITGADLTVTAAVAAKLSDPYIVGAVMYQDDNANKTFDTGEPESTVTDATGGFTFSVPLTSGKEIRIKTQGKHEGVTYDTALVGVVDANGDIKAVTPLTTFTSKGLTTQQLADILNYAATNASGGALQIDGEAWQISPTNLNLDPLSSGGNLLSIDVTSLTGAQLRDLQGSLTAYALLKIFEGSTTLKNMDAATLYSESQRTDGVVYLLATNMLQGVTNALNKEFLDTIEASLAVLRQVLIDNGGGAITVANVTTFAPTPTVDMLAKISVTTMERIATAGFTACNAEGGSADADFGPTATTTVGAKIQAALGAAGATAATFTANSNAKIMEIGLKLYGLKYASALSSNAVIATILGSAGTEGGYLSEGIESAQNGAVTFRFDASNNVVPLDANGNVVTLP